MGADRTIVVSSRALGPRLRVTVLLYDDLTELRRAANLYNGIDHSDSLGVTQRTEDETGRTVSVLIRMVRGHLGTRIVSHEMHHAATALYGATLPDQIDPRDHLHHANEEFAHFYSDLLHRLVDRLYALGYYDED